MKFQKTLVAVAIAGIAAVPMVASADTTLSGLVQINFQGDDRDLPGDDVSADPKFAAGDVFIQANTEHELNNGLTGYGNIRQDMNSLSNDGSFSTDSIYAGIKGGFGDIRVGEIPLAVEVGQMANDIFDVGDEINGGISYVGTFGPVGLTANFSPEPNSDAVGVGANFGLGGFSIGVGAEDRAESQNIAAGASFAFAGASIGVHYWTKELSGEFGEDTGIFGDDEESLAVKVGYGFGGVDAALTFATATTTLDGGLEPEATAIRLDLGYELGGGTRISTRITAYTLDSVEFAGGTAGYEASDTLDDVTEWRLQLAKSF